MKIVFMGTPEFAVPSLEILVKNGYEVVAVVTAPDRPAGRGQKLSPSPVKEFAISQNLKVLQPEKMKDPGFLEELIALKPDLAIVVAFRMLPRAVWEIPATGTLNLHGSLLPDYRGAAPINWVIINGEEKTGITTFFIDKEIDTGGLLLQEEMDIPQKWTAGDLHDAMMQKGANLVLKTVKQLEAGELRPVPQDESKFIHKAPKIFKEDCRIDWTRSAEEIYNFIRGLSPYPTAWTTLNEKNVKVFFGTIAEPSPIPQKAGTIGSDGQNYLRIHTGNGVLSVESIQLEGKKRLEIVEFLRGYKEIPDKFE